MKNNNYQLNIFVHSKNTNKYINISEYNHEGKTFIEGRKGSEFELEFVNNTCNRVLVVPSVDGVSTLKSEVATPDSPGLVVNGYQTIRIPGWKYSTENAGRFMFKNKEESYGATQTGSVKNVGVIGILVFEEKRDIFQYSGYLPGAYPHPPMWATLNDPLPTRGHHISNICFNTVPTCSASNAVKTASIPPAQNSENLFSLGVGWGEKTEFKTVSTTFNRGNSVAQLVIYYDSRKNLEKRGIRLVKKESSYKTQELPSPFQGACIPPNGWKG